MYGARVATGDFDGDGNDELVVAAGPNGKSQVRIYDLNGDGTIGNLIESRSVFGAAETAGMQVATGDCNGDGIDELYVAMDKGGGKIRSFADIDHDGFVFDNVADNLSPFGASYTGGIALALGNTDNDFASRDELIVGQASGGSLVKIYSNTAQDLKYSNDAVLESFTAFAASYKGGVNLAARPLSLVNDTDSEIFVSGATNSRVIRVYTDSNANGKVSDNALAEVITYGPSNLPGGIRMAAGDTDASGFFIELVTVTGKGVAPDLRIYDDNSDVDTKIGNNPFADEFSPFAANQTVGLYAAVAKVQGETFTYQGSPQFIPDASTTRSYIQIPTSAGIIRDLDISLSIAHTFIGDLDVTLTNVATGKSVVLFTDIGGSNDGLMVRLNDESGGDLSQVSTSGDNLISGSFKLEGGDLLSLFDGMDASGQWMLTVTDDSTSDTGSLFGWQLHLTY